MNPLFRYKLAILGVTALVGAGCLQASALPDKGNSEPETATSTTLEAFLNPPEDVTSTDFEVTRVVDWRSHLDMGNWIEQGVAGLATFKIPTLFFEPNDSVSDVPEMQYSLRFEKYEYFADEDTPWHTKSDIEEQVRYVAGSNQIPRIDQLLDRLVRYSKSNVNGYFSYECYFGDGNALSSVFTFFDKEKNRYRFEMFEDRDDWQGMEESQFKRACNAYLENLLRGKVPDDIQNKYRIRQQMIDSIRVN